MAFRELPCNCGIRSLVYSKWIARLARNHYWGDWYGLPEVDYLGGGFKYFLFSALFGEIIKLDEHIFQMGWFNHQLVIVHGLYSSVVRVCCSNQQLRSWAD